jgi:hypothetical protein
MVRSRRTAVVLASAGLLAAGAFAWAAEGVPYPAGFRAFRHVKSTVVGKQSPLFERQGGIHHFYANDPAREGYRTGQFPDGSVLIDDLVEALEKDGVATEGPRRRTAVMVKDAARYPDTGGWGFEVFAGEAREGRLAPAARAACFACHAKAKGSVFTELRE